MAIYLPDSELKQEIDLINYLTEAIASQYVKLNKLLAEGKISDSTYRDFLEELRKRATISARSVNELLSRVDDRVKQINGHIAQLRHELELLEVRHTIGAISDDKYGVAFEGVEIKLNEIEGERKGIVEPTAKIIERHIEKFITMPQKPTLPAVESAVQPVNPHSVGPVMDFSQNNETKSTKEHKVITCPRCGKDNLEPDIYCYNCGARRM